MNNLTELQTELRRLSRELEGLVAQVEGMKEHDSHEAEDFAALEELARRDPLGNPALKALGGQDREQYLRLMSTAAALDGDLSPEQLLYLCRAAAGAGEEVEAQKLYGMAYQTDRLEWQASAAGLREVRRPLLLDLLMLANMNGPASDRAMEFIAELAGLLGCDQEEAEVVSKLSAALLSKSYSAFQSIQPEKPYPDMAYAVSPEWIEKSRNYCGYYHEGKIAYDNSKIKAKNGYEEMIKYFIDGPFPLGWLTTTRLVPEGSLVTGDMELVKISFECNVDFSEFDVVFVRPKIEPITAQANGFVYYIPCENGYFDIWITGAFDSGENFPAVPHKEANK